MQYPQRSIAAALPVLVALAACATGHLDTDPAPPLAAPDAADASIAPPDGGAPARDAALADARDAGADAPAIPRDGLVAEWLFAGGTDDTSGRGHHGLAIDTVAAADRHGVARAALSFNGTSAYVQAASAPDLDLRGAFTVSVWVRPRTFGWLRGLVSKYRSTAAHGFTLRLTAVAPFDGLDFLESTTAPDGGVASGKLAVDRWQHVAAVADGRAVTVWIDGALVQQATAGYDATVNGDALAIGSDYDARFFDGLLDDVRLYARALRPDEVRALAAE